MAFESLNPEPTQTGTEGHPLTRLSREDLDLITEFVLHSGSLKDLGQAYGVSYPTIRSRMDALISRLRLAIDGRRPDPLSDLLANLVERGELTPSAARSIRDTARQSQEKQP